MEDINKLTQVISPTENVLRAGIVVDTKGSEIRYKIRYVFHGKRFILFGKRVHRHKYIKLERWASRKPLFGSKVLLDTDFDYVKSVLKYLFPSCQENAMYYYNRTK